MSTSLLPTRIQGPFDFKRALDVELTADNLCLCLPDVNDVDGARAACFVLDLYYSHCWRGFVQTGPGKVTMFADARLQQMFIAHFDNIAEEYASSILSPFRLLFSKQFNVTAAEDSFAHNSAVLARFGNLGPALSLSPALLGIARGPDPGVIQYVACTPSACV